MKKIAVMAILYCAMLVPGWGASLSPCDLRVDDRASLYHTEWKDLLKAGEYEKLNVSMEKNYQDILKDGDGDHLFNFSPFLNMISNSGGKLLSQWKKEMPNAFFSNYASGEYWVRETENKRRNRAANDIDARDWKIIRDMQQNARNDFAMARLAKPNRAIVDAALIGIDATDNGPEATVADLQHANAVDPKNILARVMAINYLAPRWGGSFEAMDDVISQAKSTKLPETHIAYLTMVAENTKGSHFEVIERDKVRAREHYKKAYAICNKSSFAIDGLARTTGN